MNVLVHGAGSVAPLVVEVEETDTIAILKEKIMVTGWPVERELLSLTIHETDVELPDRSTIAELDIRAGMRLIGHTCRLVAVEVTYNGEPVKDDFRGGTTVKAVLLWALPKFKIDPKEIGDFELQYGNPPTTATDDTPLVDLPLCDCSIGFSLVRTDFHKG